MPFIFKLAAFYSARAHRLSRCAAFERLNPRHLVAAHDLAAQRVQADFITGQIRRVDGGWSYL